VCPGASHTQPAEGGAQKLREAAPLGTEGVGGEPTCSCLLVPLPSPPYHPYSCPSPCQSPRVCQLVGVGRWTGGAWGPSSSQGENPHRTILAPLPRVSHPRSHREASRRCTSRGRGQGQGAGAGAAHPCSDWERGTVAGTAFLGTQEGLPLGAGPTQGSCCVLLGMVAWG